MNTPHNLGPRGLELWHSVTADFEPSPAEATILTDTCRALDMIEELRADIAERGVMISGSQGQDRAHPGIALIVSLQGQVQRALTRLGLVGADEEQDTRSADVKAFQSAQAAANARWSRR